MGFYLRKSVRVGPLRFNLSKSGIGVSAGIPGLRIGTGPRGNYIHAGRGGFYYRASLPSGQSPRSLGVSTERIPVAATDDPTVGPAVAIESGSVLAMTDETSEGLLREMREKQAIWRLWPAVLVVGVVAFIGLQEVLAGIGQGILGAFVLLATIVAYQRDALRKTTVVMYDLSSDAAADFEALVRAVGDLRSAQAMWHVASEAGVRDRKYHAGAASVINRTPTSIGNGLPRFVKCNLDVPNVRVGRQSLYFFPDRLLVFDSGSVGAVSYSTLEIDRRPQRFVEGDSVPRDAQVVGRTWKYVNKNGGPDRRFKDNRELPVCEYEDVHFRSATGLNELLQVSRPGAGAALQQLIASRGQQYRTDPRSLYAGR